MVTQSQLTIELSVSIPMFTSNRGDLVQRYLYIKSDLVAKIL